MMLIRVLGFGSNWWARYGSDPGDRHRFTRHAAYFNSTGIRCGNKIKRHWIVPGLIRFNGVGDFNPHFPSRSLRNIFECADLTTFRGGNRLLIGCRAPQSANPDFYLVALRSDRFGRFDFDDRERKSNSVIEIAVSSWYEEQEVMILMRAGDWVKSSLGVWQLAITESGEHQPQMELLGDSMIR